MALRQPGDCIQLCAHRPHRPLGPHLPRLRPRWTGPRSDIRGTLRDRTDFVSGNAQRGTTRMADVGRTAAPRVLRLVAAGGPGAFDGEIRFHRRLTVLADGRAALADWVVSLLGVQAPPDTLLEIDNVPARTYDLPRALRALPLAEPMRVEMIRALAAGRDVGRAGTRPRSAHQIGEELSRWERVLGEA